MALPQEAVPVIQEMEDNERAINELKARNLELKAEYSRIINRSRLEAQGINVDDLITSLN